MVAAIIDFRRIGGARLSAKGSRYLYENGWQYSLS
jgi:hypothetical protein